MKKNFTKFLSMFLAASMVATVALPVQAATGQEKAASDYMYGVVDMNYADFYYGELENVEPDGKTTVTAVSQDPVTAKGYREEGMYDAATFATPAAFDYKSKWDTWPGTYSEPVVDEDGVVQGGKILGVSEVSVAISKELYDNAMKDSSATVLQSKIKEISFNEDQSVVPKSYKVLNSDGVYTKYVNTTEPTSTDLTGSIYTTFMGDDNWWEGNGMNVSADQTILGGFVEWTADPTDANSKHYVAGLKHEENIWSTRWIGWGVGPNAQGIYGGNEVGWKRFKGISGKYVTKLMLILQNEDGSVTYHTGNSSAGMISPLLPNGVVKEDGSQPYDLKIVNHKYTKDRLVLDITYDIPVMEDGKVEADYWIYKLNIPSVVKSSLSLETIDKEAIPVYEESEWKNGHKDIHLEINRDYIGTGRLKYWATVNTKNKPEGARNFSGIARWYNLTTGLTSKDVYIKNNRLYVDSSIFDVNDYRLNTYQKVVITDSEGETLTFETGDSNTNNKILSAMIDKRGNFNLDAIYTYTTGRGQNKVEHNDPIFPKKDSVSYEITMYSGGFPIVKGELNFRNDQEISVANDNYNVVYGDKAFNLGAKSTGDSKLTYKSNNEKVAAVAEDGTVTIKGAGKAVVTVAAEKSGKYNATTKEVTVNVVKAKQNVTVKNASKTYGDKAFNLNAKASANGKLAYQSNNTKVATVDSNGKVTIKGAGTAKITVSAAATANYEKASATATVTVKKAKQTITAKDVSKAYGAKAFSLGAKASGKLTYKSSDAKVATVDKNGKVTVKGTGVATITVSAAATTNYEKASKKVMVKVAPKAVTLTKVTSSKAKTVVVTWKKDSKVTGYQIQYSTDKKFAKAKTVTISKASIVTKTISKLTSKKTYYVRACAYKKSGKTTVTGAYGAAKSVKVK